MKRIAIGCVLAMVWYILSIVIGTAKLLISNADMLTIPAGAAELATDPRGSQPPASVLCSARNAQKAADEAKAVIADIQTARRSILTLSPRLDATWATELAILVVKYARENQLDVNFVVSVIFTESGFHPNANNRKTGCHGLMQIRYIHNLKSPFDPECNIRFGCALLRRYIDERGGDPRRGLWRWGLEDRTARKVIARAEWLNELQPPIYIEPEVEQQAVAPARFDRVWKFNTEEQ
jgi:hypothetical protein